jgi:hypothetical protein
MVKALSAERWCDLTSILTPPSHSRRIKLSGGSSGLPAIDSVQAGIFTLETPPPEKKMRIEGYMRAYTGQNYQPSTSKVANSAITPHLE